MSELPVVRIVLIVKDAFREKLNFPQDFWWPFLRDKQIYFLTCVT